MPPSLLPTPGGRVTGNPIRAVYTRLLPDMWASTCPMGGGTRPLCYYRQLGNDADRRIKKVIGATMLTLCVCSTEGGAGKTAFVVGLGTRMQRDRLRVEYVRTVTRSSDLSQSQEDNDFVRRSLRLPAARPTGFPVSIAHAIVSGEREAHPLDELIALQRSLAASTDVLLVETGPTIADGVLLGISTPEVVRALDARALVIASYTGGAVIEAVLAARLSLGSSVVGAVVTGIPTTRMEFAKGTLRSALERRGIRVFGNFPADRLLTAVTVGELAARLGGTFVAGVDHAEDLVERLMVGAMNAEHATSFFMRHSNKAVVTGGDRPEIQLAAIATPTRCLILTGQFAPDPTVIARANEAGVAVVSVPVDSLSAIELSQEVFASTRFRQDKKVGRFVEQFQRHFDMAALYSGLELRPAAPE